MNDGLLSRLEAAQDERDYYKALCVARGSALLRETDRVQSAWKAQWAAEARLAAIEAAASDVVWFDYCDDDEDVQEAIKRLRDLVNATERTTREAFDNGPGCLGGAPHWWDINADTGLPECRLCHKSPYASAKESL